MWPPVTRTGKGKKIIKFVWRTLWIALYCTYYSCLNYPVLCRYDVMVHIHNPPNKHICHSSTLPQSCFVLFRVYVLLEDSTIYWAWASYDSECSLFFNIRGSGIRWQAVSYFLFMNEQLGNVFISNRIKILIFKHNKIFTLARRSWSGEIGKSVWVHQQTLATGSLHSYL